MRRFQSALLAAAAAFGFASVACAADMPVKAPVAAPLAPVWTGFYVGLNGGYGWADGTTIGHLDDNPQGISPKGGFGGGQIGYNFQIGSIVLGAEADFQGSGLKDSMTDLNFGDSFSSKMDWFGTVRGRIGYTFNPVNPLLVYFTGGFAYGHIVTDVTSPSLLGAPYHFSGTSTGYTLGGGVEYKITPAWSLKVEYQRINLGTNDPTNPAGATFSSVLSREILNASEFDTVRVGVNYKF